MEHENFNIRFVSWQHKNQAWGRIYQVILQPNPWEERPRYSTYNNGWSLQDIDHALHHLGSEHKCHLSSWEYFLNTTRPDVTIVWGCNWHKIHVVTSPKCGGMLRVSIPLFPFPGWTHNKTNQRSGWSTLLMSQCANEPPDITSMAQQESARQSQTWRIAISRRLVANCQGCKGVNSNKHPPLSFHAVCLGINRWPRPKRCHFGRMSG